MASNHSDAWRQVYLLLGEEQSGPFTIEQIRGLWNQAAITSDAYYWHEGMENWESLAALMTERAPTSHAREGSDNATTEPNPNELRAKARHAAVAESHGLTFADLGDPEVVEKIRQLRASVPGEVARRHHILPLQQTDHCLQVAVGDPKNFEAFDAVPFLLKTEVVFVYADPEKVESLLADIYRPNNDISANNARQSVQRSSHLPYCSSCRCHVNPNVVSRSKTGPGAAIAVGDNYLLAQRSTSELIKVCPKCGERVYNEADRAELVKKVDSDLATGMALAWIFGALIIIVIVTAIWVNL